MPFMSVAPYHLPKDIRPHCALDEGNINSSPSAATFYRTNRLLPLSTFFEDPAPAVGGTFPTPTTATTPFPVVTGAPLQQSGGFIIPTSRLRQLLLWWYIRYPAQAVGGSSYLPAGQPRRRYLYSKAAVPAGPTALPTTATTPSRW